MSVIHDNVGPV